MSKHWKEQIECSALEKIVFRYESESKEILRLSERRYQHVKVKQEASNETSDFLSILAEHLSSLESLSFEGIFTSEMMESFRVKEFKVKELNFIGNKTDLGTFLESFSSFIDCGKFHVMTFSEVSVKNFVKNLKHVKAEKVVLENMKFKKQKIGNFSSNNSIKEIQLIFTKFDKISMEFLLKFCPVVETVTSCDWISTGRRIKNVVERLGKNVVELPLPTQDLLSMKIPEDVHENVFQHIPHDDLIEFSTVSKAWWGFTKSFIGKKTLFHYEGLRDVGEQQLRRNYRNIFSNAIEIKRLLDSCLDSFTANLEYISLEIEPNTFKRVLNFFTQSRFPRLSALSLACDEKEFLDDLTLPASLKELQLSNFSIKSTKFLETKFSDFLKSSNKLERLMFYDCNDLNKLFSQDIARFTDYKLKTLRLEIHQKGVIRGLSKNFNRFLMKHSETLSELNLYMTDVTTVENLMKNFKLKSFEFMHVIGKASKLKSTSSSLTHLQLPFMSLKDHLPYLKLAPNLETIHVRHLDDEILEFVTSNLKSLKEIRFSEINLVRNSSKVVNGRFGKIELTEDDFQFEEHDMQVNQNHDRDQN